MTFALAQGASPLGKESVVFTLDILDVVPMHTLNVILMHILDALLLLLLLATTVIASLFWELHHCNNGA